jgi:hypothetical protein
MTDPFLEEDFRVLTPEAFEFVLTNELKRALRSQNFVTLLVVEPAFQGVPGGGNGERARAVREVARLFSRDTSHNQLSVVLLDADLENAIGVVDRLMARLDHYDFPRPLTFEVGAACCPTHGVDAESLRRAAESRPVRSRGDRFKAN